jgi:hypothetical protein
MIISVIIALISVVFAVVVTYHYAQDETIVYHQKRMIQYQFNLKKDTVNYKVKSDVETPGFIAQSMINDRNFDNKYHITIFYNIKEYEKEILRVNGLKRDTALKPGQTIKLPVFVKKSK